MTSYDRQTKILDLLKENKYMTVQNISASLFSSGATIRRDLADMAERGLIKRVRGGAVLFDSIAQELPRILRENLNTEKKKRIAQLALPFLHDSMTVFLDSSSTTVALAEKMDSLKKMTVITNSLPAACHLNDSSNATIYLCGGLISNHNATAGISTVSFVKQICADAIFFSCRGLSTEFGTMESSIDIASVKMQMLENAQKRILLCDSTKIDKVYFYKCWPIDKIDVIICDQRPPLSFTNALPESVELIY